MIRQFVLGHTELDGLLVNVLMERRDIEGRTAPLGAAVDDGADGLPGV